MRWKQIICEIIGMLNGRFDHEMNPLYPPSKQGGMLFFMQFVEF